MASFHMREEWVWEKKFYSLVSGFEVWIKKEPENLYSKQSLEVGKSPHLR